MSLLIDEKLIANIKKEMKKKGQNSVKKSKKSPMKREFTYLKVSPENPLSFKQGSTQKDCQRTDSCRPVNESNLTSEILA